MPLGPCPAALPADLSGDHWPARVECWQPDSPPRGPAMRTGIAAPLAHGCSCCCGRGAPGRRGAGRRAAVCGAVCGEGWARSAWRARRSGAGMLGGARGAGRDRAQGAGRRAHGAGQGRARGAVGVAVEFEAGLHPVPMIAKGRWRGRVDTGSGVGAKQRHRRCRGRRGPAARRVVRLGRAGVGSSRLGWARAPVTARKRRTIGAASLVLAAALAARALALDSWVCWSRCGRRARRQHRQREQQGLVAKVVV